MRLATLTYVAFELNAAIDAGADIPLADMQQALKKGEPFALLESRIGKHIDLSMLEAADRSTLAEHWEELHLVINERSKMGVTKSGLCLLIAFILELIRRAPESMDAEWTVKPLKSK